VYKRGRFVEDFIVGVGLLLSLFQRKAKKGGLTSVVFTAEGIAFAHTSKKQSEIKLDLCDFQPSSAPLKEASKFTNYVNSKALDGTEAAIVLPHDCYQILLVEKPSVPDAELIDALRWRVKDLVSFDIEQTIIDYIDLPEDAYRNRSPMVYVVVAQQKKVEAYIGWCQEIGLSPVIVDVPELALLNLSEDLADEEAGLAVFFVDSKNSSINLMSDSALYFTRQLQYNLYSGPESASAAVLEMQRSMDYYESQIGKPPCVRLIAFPMLMEDDPLISELRYNLPMDIHSLNLENLVDSDLELSAELQKKTTIAIAAALRAQSEVGAKA